MQKKMLALFLAFTSAPLFGQSLHSLAPLTEAARESGLSTEDWVSIQEAREREAHTIFETVDGVEAKHPSQGLHTIFDGRGFQTEPSQGEGAEEPWSWGMELASYGFDGHERSDVGVSDSHAVGQRFSYSRGESLDEWFVNRSGGLEHGFILKDRPVGPMECGLDLAFRMTITGSLAGVLDEDCQGLRFCDVGGDTVLTYRNLLVFDAMDRVLPSRFTLFHNQLSITIDETGACYPITVDPVVQSAYLKAAHPDTFDDFGRSVAAGTDFVVVGAPGESGSSPGVNGDQTSNGTSGAGAAYIFSRTNGVWSQEAYLKSPAPTDSAFGRFFGRSVATDGNVVGVYADRTGPVAGGVYLFEKIGGQWSQTSRIATTALSHVQIAISGDRVLVASGSENSQINGRVYVRSGGAWSQEALLTPPVAFANVSNDSAADLDGDTVVIGVYRGLFNQPATGQAFVYERTGGGWVLADTLHASNPDFGDRFGQAVRVNNGRIAVGAPGESSVTAGVLGDDSDNLRPRSGAVYIFDKVVGTWTQTSILKAHNAGENDEFGSSIAMSGDRIAVGAIYEEGPAHGVDGQGHLNGLSRAGAAYLFLDEGGAWKQEAYIKASNPMEWQWFGAATNQALGLSDSLLVVGNFWESSTGSGVNGDQSMTTPASARTGAAYIFDLEAPIASYCDDAISNSTGASASLSHLGSIVASQNAATIQVSGMPVGTFGMILSSRGRTIVPMSGGSVGTRCLGGGVHIGRHLDSVSASSSQGMITYPLDLSQFPAAGGFQTVTAGETWHFQCWYRDFDGAPISNYSGGLSIRFE